MKGRTEQFYGNISPRYPWRCELRNLLQRTLEHRKFSTCFQTWELFVSELSTKQFCEYTSERFFFLLKKSLLYCIRYVWAKLLYSERRTKCDRRRISSLKSFWTVPISRISCFFLIRLVVNSKDVFIRNETCFMNVLENLKKKNWQKGCEAFWGAVKHSWMMLWESKHESGSYLFCSFLLFQTRNYHWFKPLSIVFLICLELEFLFPELKNFDSPIQFLSYTWMF